MKYKEGLIMEYLRGNVFNLILNSNKASSNLKHGVRYTIMGLYAKDAFSMVHYYRSAIIGSEKAQNLLGK